MLIYNGDKTEQETNLLAFVTLLVSYVPTLNAFYKSGGGVQETCESVPDDLAPGPQVHGRGRQ